MNKNSSTICCYSFCIFQLECCWINYYLCWILWKKSNLMYQVGTYRLPLTGEEKLAAVSQGNPFLHLFKLTNLCYINWVLCSFLICPIALFSFFQCYFVVFCCQNKKKKSSASVCTIRGDIFRIENPSVWQIPLFSQILPTRYMGRLCV
jgi:hypothetical protein